MKTLQTIITSTAETDAEIDKLAMVKPDLVLVFGAVGYFKGTGLAASLQSALPEAIIAGCSTAGEIAVDRVYDNTCVLTAIKFDRASAQAATTRIESMEDSSSAGARLAALLPQEGLNAVLLFGTGVAINGSALVTGLQAGLPANVAISGGLAADGGAFRQTWTIGPNGATSDHIVAVGLYGAQLKVGYGTYAGWEPFGPARKVTRCEGNVLFELDGARALDVYKNYLGEYARDLPGSGLLFPFEMLSEAQQKNGIFRTILGINEDDGSLTLAGDIDPKGYLKLMHSTTEKLIEGAETAADLAREDHGETHGQALAILVSCIGRKLVMGDRVDEEVETVADQLGRNTAVTGFYSNGEIAKSTYFGDCRLHNQTMTITWISED